MDPASRSSGQPAAGPVFEAIAKEGSGVAETLVAISRLVFSSLRKTLLLPGDTAEAESYEVIGDVAARIKPQPEALELFAQSLDARDLVALGVTGTAWEIARILEPHVARVIVVVSRRGAMRDAR